MLQKLEQVNFHISFIQNYACFNRIKHAEHDHAGASKKRWDENWQNCRSNTVIARRIIKLNQRR